MGQGLLPQLPVYPTPLTALGVPPIAYDAQAGAEHACVEDECETEVSGESVLGYARD
jgi:hypothetical protein